MTILNLRDVGATINRSTGQRLLAEGRLFRSARPDEATAEERRMLVEDLGIKTIIGLRSKTEHIEQARKRDARVHASALIPQSNDEMAAPLKISGIDYCEFDFNGSAFSRHLVSQLSWWNFGRLIALMALGYRLEAVSIIGVNVLQPRGLVGLATASLNICTAEVLRVFEVLAEESSYPVLFHCTQGKDRMGLIAILIGALLEIPTIALEHDYLLSQRELETEKEERLKEIRSIGLGDEFGDCDRQMVSAVLEHLHDTSGGIEAYLSSCGVDSEMEQSVCRNLRSVEHS